jgi:hypothetical protein
MGALLVDYTGLKRPGKRPIWAVKACLKNDKRLILSITYNGIRLQDGKVKKICQLKRKVLCESAPAVYNDQAF